jgi:hypothetical protein
MEEQLKTEGGQFAFSSLKIRTMQDDLKRSSSPEEEKPIAMSALPATPPPEMATKEIIGKTPEPVRPQKIVARPMPEPPPYLPQEPMQSTAAETKSAPMEAPEPIPGPLPMAPSEELPTGQPDTALTYLQSNVTYEPQKIKSEAAPAPKRMKLGLVFGVSAGVVILAIFGFIYFYFWNTPAPKPLCPEGQITAECRCGEQATETKTAGYCCNNLWIDYDCGLTKLPQPIIPSISDSLTFNDVSDASSLMPDILNSNTGITDEGAKIITLNLANSPPRYATLDDLIKIFGLILPDQIKSNNKSFNLLLYVNQSPNYIFSTSSLALLDASSSPEILATSTPEYRLVLVLEQKDPSGLEQIMTNWEQTMLDDMRPLIFGQPYGSASPEFISTVYHNGSFRYKNLPLKNTTINYFIDQNLIILGTSKNSIFYVYDALNPNNSSPED